MSDRSGNFGIIFALLLPALLITTGGALTYGQALSDKKSLQNALDIATLGGFGDDGNFDRSVAEAIFANNARGIPYANLNFAIAEDGGVTGTVDGERPVIFLQIVGMDTVNFHAAATVSPMTELKVVSATFKPINIEGAYDKDIYFFTRDASGKKTVRELILSYDYTLDRYGRASKVVTPNLNQTRTITVGDYASFGYEMVVYEDLTYRGNRSGRNTTVISYDSDDGAWESRMRIDGSCEDNGGATIHWEDGGDWNFKDFEYT
ncbi:TadE/TadG family type IV pilus assembly protein [Fulvimarina sp. MAC8]|uniref:TadE/TadG family type IV pilus assembly protein n=1 Tax=Fulvimarina sp. MAC8 TaxID=3162874 RepID=UPI0032EF02A9